jgi:glycosyltransferase involved in cell wall biosynthesis
MKIGFFCGSRAWGGLEINNLRLCRWLKERGLQPILFCESNTRLADEAAIHGIEKMELGTHTKHFSFRTAYQLSRTLSRQQINIVVIGHYHHFYMSVWAKIFSGQSLRIVYWQQMQLVLNKKDFYHSFFYRRLDAWITPLNYLKSQLMANTVLPLDKITVIPLGVEIELFSKANAEKREQSRKELSLPLNEFIVGTIGRIDRQKAQGSLIESIKILKDKGLPIKAVFVGEETLGEEGYLAELVRLTNIYGLQNEVYFKPFVKDVPLAFAALDVFVMPSLSEPIGMVTVEAMASGLPVVGTNSGGTPELLDNGNAGLLFDPCDAGKLADHIYSLYHSPSERSSLGANAQLCASQYSHNLQCQLFEKLLNQL